MPPQGVPSPQMPPPPVDFENIFFAIYQFITDPGGFLNTAPGLGVLRVMLSLLTLFFLITCIILTFKRVRLAHIEREQVAYIPQAAIVVGKNPRWELVLDHVNSPNSSDWRIAIMEADNMLFEMVQAMGYRSDTLGEALKSVEPSDFNTLDDAWEAHKVRNVIAHEGSRYRMTQREARRVIALYEKVFQEFGYV